MQNSKQEEVTYLKQKEENKLIKIIRSRLGLGFIATAQTWQWEEKKGRVEERGWVALVGNNCCARILVPEGPPSFSFACLWDENKKCSKSLNRILRGSLGTSSIEIPFVKTDINYVFKMILFPSRRNFHSL